MLVKQQAWCVLAILLSAVTTWGQNVPEFKHPPKAPIRKLLTAQVGESVNLGYFLLSESYGASVEIPVSHLFELQTGTSYSPDRRVLSSDSSQISTRGAAIFWPTYRFGISGAYDHNWLWTPQFDRAGWKSGPGVVIRDDLAYPGRTYFSYNFVGGCVWGTPSNPCRIESGRTRGIDVSQEFGITSSLRLGLNGSILRYCDLTAQNTPAGCHYGMREYLSITLELPGRKADELY